jgi:hypothetical protein
MPKKTAAQRDAERRAEARRRSRLVAQGRVEESEDESEEAPARPPSMSFLQRIFPPAAPLPGKPPPLAGFTYSGRLRPIVLGGWLIRQNLFAGVLMGLLWAGSYILVGQYGSSLIGTIASFVSFGSLVAAGWLGWQRPWFYGLVASVVGYLLYAPYFVLAYSHNPSSSPTDLHYVAPAQVATFLATNGLLQAAIGALAGFYGGYLRRRLADPATRQAAAARRRR